MPNKLSNDIGMEKQKANGEWTNSSRYDSSNWKTVIAGKNLSKLCECIKNHSENIWHMFDVIESLFFVVWTIFNAFT